MNKRDKRVFPEDENDEKNWTPLQLDSGNGTRRSPSEGELCKLDVDSPRINYRH